MHSGRTSTSKEELFAEKVKGGSRAAATSKMERFVIIVNGWKPLTIITKCSILDVAAALYLPLLCVLSSLQYLTDYWSVIIR